MYAQWWEWELIIAHKLTYISLKGIECECGFQPVVQGPLRGRRLCRGLRFFHLKFRGLQMKKV